MNGAGYLTRFPDGLAGTRGMCYDYITAANGVFIEAEGKLMAARIPICQPTWASIRGLALDTAKIALRHGPIPKLIFDTAVGMLYVQKNIEGYIVLIKTEKQTVWPTKYLIMS
jgi:hypothetical protein